MDAFLISQSIAVFELENILAGYNKIFHWVKKNKSKTSESQVSWKEL